MQDRMKKSRVKNQPVHVGLLRSLLTHSYLHISKL